MTAITRTNRIKIATHRGKEDTVFGKHSRVPFQLDNIDARSLIVLAFIDIDQFLDSSYKLGGDRRTISLESFIAVLGLSKNTVRKCLKDLEDKGIITATFRNRIGTSYVSNILKLRIKYQIITYSFISRPDLSHSVKAFIIKVIMLGDRRISNISNITALVKETGVSRRAINLILEDLDSKGYLLNAALGDGTKILDVESIMLDSEEKLLLEHRELRAKVNVFQNFSSFEQEIVELNKRIGVLLKKIEMLKQDSSEETPQIIR
jgi:biotin operon repressor